MSPQSAVSSPIQAGIAAVRANLLPALLLQSIALSILLAYYFHPATRAIFSSLELLRERHGLLFAAISTPMFAAVIPMLLQKLQRSDRTKATLRQLPFLLLLWSYKGVESDLFYRFQAWMFGDSIDVQTVFLKVMVDQLVFCLIWAAPSTLVAYAFKDANYSWSGAMQLLGPHWIRRRMIPIMFSNWAVWIPAVTIIYCLPTTLQLPMQNIVLCMWVMIFMFLTGQERPVRDILFDEVDLRVIANTVDNTTS